MLTNELLGTIVVRSVIFHDVPNHRGTGGAEVTLSTQITRINADHRRMLQEKLTKVLASRRAYGIIFNAQTTSPVPAAVRVHTASGYSAQHLVEMSQGLARHLYGLQNGAISPGLLCVIDIVAGGRHGLVLMKLEREAGAALEPVREGAEIHFDMDLFSNLILTDGTRLFKTAAFLRIGLGDDDFAMTACDGQHQTTDSTEMARFWLLYLGCTVEEEPRVTTAKFYNASLDFLNTHVTDPLQKTQLYESLHTEMQSNRREITPRDFIRDYVSPEIQPSYRDFLEDRHVQLNSTFNKDVATIKNVLRRLTYISAEGVRVVAPEGREGLVQVNDETILVNDRLLSVGPR